MAPLCVHLLVQSSVGEIFVFFNSCGNPQSLEPWAHYLAPSALVRENYAQNWQTADGKCLLLEEPEEGAQMPWLLLPSPVQSGSPRTAFTYIRFKFKCHAQARLIPGESGIFPMYLRLPIQPVLGATSLGSGQY